jgi:phosphate transport system permease protein
VLAAAAIVVLLVVLLAMNSVAIWLHNRFYQRRW